VILTVCAPVVIAAVSVLPALARIGFACLAREAGIVRVEAVSDGGQLAEDAIQFCIQLHLEGHRITGSKGVPYMVVNALVEVSDTKLIRRRRGDRRGEWRSRLD
jgi:hypothetical protein